MFGGTSVVGDTRPKDGSHDKAAGLISRSLIKTRAAAAAVVSPLSLSLLPPPLLQSMWLSLPAMATETRGVAAEVVGRKVS